MLLMNRKPSESITFAIPPSTEERLIRIEIVESSHSKVRFAIDAPKEIKISRPDGVTTCGGKLPAPVEVLI